MFNAVFFDLDGTLVDTAPEIADAVNDLLLYKSYPTVAQSLIRSWIGNGTRALLGKALAHVGATQTADSLWPRFETDYLERCGTRSRPYSGVARTLDRLVSRRMRLVVVTNKEARFAHKVLASHGLVEAFDLIVAGDTLPVRKPHPGMVWHALDALGCGPGDALLIGDSATDVRTARAASIEVWAVRYGYQKWDLADEDVPDRFIDHFDDIDTALHQAATANSGMRVAID